MLEACLLLLLESLLKRMQGFYHDVISVLVFFVDFSFQLMQNGMKGARCEEPYGDVDPTHPDYRTAAVTRLFIHCIPLLQWGDPHFSKIVGPSTVGYKYAIHLL